MAKAAQASETARKRKREPAAARVGERVAGYRNERQLKVSELARMVGVSPSLISQIERDQSQPSVSTLFALAEALEVPVDAFFAKDDENGASRPRSRATAPRDGAGDAERPDTDVRYVVRRDARAAIDIEGGVRWERLTAETLPDVDFLELVYAPGSESHSELYRHPGS